MSRRNGKVADLVSPAISVLREGPEDEGTRQKWPVLSSCLWPVWSAEKCVRQAGSLRLHIAGNHYLLKLSCPTEGVETTLVATTLVDLLDQMEMYLTSGKVVWVPDYETTKRARLARVK